MNTKTVESSKETIAGDSLPGFDITCTIGRVDFMALGDFKSPQEAAMALIGRHDAEGTYEFTFGSERLVTYRVTVEKP